ncbi:MAG: 4-hydroxy-3-methylbut-2-enyl diphosphate reductase [Desulfovibrionaceae bacterium]
MPNIIRAHYAGFCMGVNLALKKLDAAMLSNTIATLGPVIHNTQVLDNYKNKGVSIYSMDEAKNNPDNKTILIRAHGIPKEEEEILKNKKTNLVDATCPKVKDAQMKIAEFYSKGYSILLYGEPEHAEIKGLCSYAKEDIFVFESLEQLQQHTFSSKKRYALASQTTQSVTELSLILEWLHSTIDNTIPLIETICDATLVRQKEVQELILSVEALVVIGGYTSGNTKRLYEIAKEAGLYTIHVETADEIDIELLRKFNTIGLAAGASTPKQAIDEAEALLQSI